MAATVRMGAGSRRTRASEEDDDNDEERRQLDQINERLKQLEEEDPSLAGMQSTKEELEFSTDEVLAGSQQLEDEYEFVDVVPP